MFLNSMPPLDVLSDDAWPRSTPAVSDWPLRWACGSTIPGHWSYLP